MKTAIILSDTHGAAPRELRDEIDQADYIIFAGDGYYALYNFLTENERAKFVAVCGNCDYEIGGDVQQVIEIEKVRIFLTHGHKYGARYSNAEIYAAAKENNCSIAIYGHSHRAENVTMDRITLFNPGSYRDSYSYGYLIVDQDKYFVKNVKI